MTKKEKVAETYQVKLFATMLRACHTAQASDKQAATAVADASAVF